MGVLVTQGLSEKERIASSPMDSAAEASKRLVAHARATATSDGEHEDDAALIAAMAIAFADFIWNDPAIGFTVKRGEFAQLMKGGAASALAAYHTHMRERVEL